MWQLNLEEGGSRAQFSGGTSPNQCPSTTLAVRACRSHCFRMLATDGAPEPPCGAGRHRRPRAWIYCHLCRVQKPFEPSRQCPAAPRMANTLAAQSDASRSPESRAATSDRTGSLGALWLGPRRIRSTIWRRAAALVARDRGGRHGVKPVSMKPMDRRRRYFFLLLNR
jgi:hypothetical protein